jgi:hypothetical protein
MLYCILNPKGLRYATLRRLPDSEIFALALFQQPCVSRYVLPYRTVDALRLALEVLT